MGIVEVRMQICADARVALIIIYQLVSRESAYAPVVEPPDHGLKANGEANAILFASPHPDFVHLDLLLVQSVVDNNSVLKAHV